MICILLSKTDDVGREKEREERQFFPKTKSKEESNTLTITIFPRSDASIPFQPNIPQQCPNHTIPQILALLGPFHPKL